MLRAIKFDKDGHNPEEPLIVDKNKHKFETFIKILFIHKINLAKNTPYNIDLIFLRTTMVKSLIRLHHLMWGTWQYLVQVTGFINSCFNARAFVLAFKRHKSAAFLRRFYCRVFSISVET